MKKIFLYEGIREIDYRYREELVPATYAIVAEEENKALELYRSKGHEPLRSPKIRELTEIKGSGVALDFIVRVLEETLGEDRVIR